MKKFLYIFFLILITSIIFLCFIINNLFDTEVTILQEDKIDKYKVILYELDSGATSSKTVNISVGEKINLNEIGTIYCATLPEISKTNFEINELDKQIIISIKERKNEILLQENKYENITILYEY